MKEQFKAKMKVNIYLFTFLITLNWSVNAQNTFSPYMVNVAGGGGNVGGIHYDYTIGEPITTFGGTSCDSIFAGFQHMAIDTPRVKKIIVSASGPLSFCLGQSVVLGNPSASGYVWNNGATTQSINVTVSGVYSSTITNSCGNTLSSLPVTVTVISPPSPSICLVTVDSLGQNNEIYWEKTQYPQADTFIVYRETNALLYTPIGRISKNLFSSYVDTNRSIGPYTGDPNFSSYKYKLQMRDNCGNLSLLSGSPYHQSINVQDAQTGQFNWNYYFIEGIGILPSASYTLWRQNILTGVSTTVGATSANFANDNQYNSLAQGGNVKWFVSTSGFVCNPTLKQIGGSSNVLVAKTRTKSNQTNERQFPQGLKDILISSKDVAVYPNPAKNSLSVKCNVLTSEDHEIEILNMLGQLMTLKSIKANSSDAQVLDVSSFVKGIYTLSIKYNGKIMCVKKIIIE
ncbi:MAG: T9SS type A sorting domain-containing protein [Bacteroidetes bacterium]|nr:T9SS type A sorting domain-containing protein [Bacteroidota bacterium]